jgi:hypothetical protein
MYSQEEKIARRLVKLVQPIHEIYEQANEFRLKELKEAILNLSENYEVLEVKKDRVESLLSITSGVIFGSLFSREEFALALHHLNIWEMYLETPIGTIAFVLWPILFVISWNFHRKVTKIMLKKDIFIEIFLEKTERLLLTTEPGDC